MDVNYRDSLTRSTVLHIACASGKVPIVKALLADKRVEVNSCTSGIMTPLHIACQHAWPEVVKLLLEHPDVDVKGKNKKDLTAFKLACEMGSAECAVLLASHTDVEIHHRTPTLQSAFYLACSNGNHAVVKALLAHPSFALTYKGKKKKKGKIEKKKVLVPAAKPKLKVQPARNKGKKKELLEDDETFDGDVDEDESEDEGPKSGKDMIPPASLKGRLGTQCLEVACEHGYLETVKLLVMDKRITDVGSLCEMKKAAQANNGDEVVFYLARCPRYPVSQAELAACLVDAAARGSLPLVEFLLAEITDFLPLASTALETAISRNRIEVAERLLREPRVDISGSQALRSACALVDSKVAYLLLNDPRGITVEAKSAALGTACSLPKPDILLKLLAAPGIDPNHSDSTYLPIPLALACQPTKLEFFRAFLAHPKIDVNFRGEALKICARLGLIEHLTDLLARPEIDVDFVSEKETPLMVACRNKHEEVATLLLRKGANPNLYTETTALSYALKSFGTHPITHRLLLATKTQDRNVLGKILAAAVASDGFEEVLASDLDFSLNDFPRFGYYDNQAYLPKQEVFLKYKRDPETDRRSLRQKLGLAGAFILPFFFFFFLLLLLLLPMNLSFTSLSD